jgi:hypothetical protein
MIKAKGNKPEEIYAEVMLVTPKMAKEWLNHNTCNRSVRSKKVDRFARIITNGLWQTTHQGVAFYDDMTLADGQHRLMAIVSANKSVALMVTYGLPKECNAALDTGTLRTLNDAMAFRGHEISRSCAATYRILYLEVIRQGDDGDCWTKESTPEPQEFESIHNVFQESVDFARSVKLKRTIEHSCLRAAIAAASFTRDKARLLEMLEIMATGTSGNPGDQAAIKIRDHLMAGHGNFSNSLASRQEIFQKCCAAVEAFCDKRPLSKLFARAFSELTFKLPSVKGL